MPRRDGGLTVQETKFLEHYSVHKDRSKAERHAKLAPRSGYAVLARPEIQKRIVQEQVTRLNTDALGIAVGTLIEIMENKKAPAAARVQASKVVLDRALPTGADGRHKDLHEMSPEEIKAALANLEGLAAAHAKDVSDASADDGDKAKKDDIFG